jgi:hypothetical protein
MASRIFAAIFGITRTIWGVCASSGDSEPPRTWRDNTVVEIPAMMLMINLPCIASVTPGSPKTSGLLTGFMARMMTFASLMACRLSCLSNTVTSADFPDNASVTRRLEDSVPTVAIRRPGAKLLLSVGSTIPAAMAVPNVPVEQMLDSERDSQHSQ